MSYSALETTILGQGEESSVTMENEQGKGRVRGLKEAIKVRKELL